MAIHAVCFVSGSILLFYSVSIPDARLLPAVALAGLFAYKYLKPGFFLVAGYLLAAWHAVEVLNARLPDDWLNREVALVGVVTGLPNADGRKTQFLFSVDTLCTVDTNDCLAVASTLTRLSWYRDAPALYAGQRWQLKVKLREPHGFMNPGGFDYEKWLFQQRIVATGYVRDSVEAELLGTVAGVGHVMQGIRAWLKQRLDAALQSSEHRGLILAIAIGDRSEVDRAQWKQFIATGTNHLLAISGLHISLVAAFAAMVAAVLWRRWRLCQRFSKHAFVCAIGFAAALMYSMLAGFSVPTQRALLMFGVVVLLGLTARHQNRHHSLVLALALVCAVDPMVVLSAGYWMSFAAVAVLFVIYNFILQAGRSRRIVAVVRGHLLITVGLYPVGILFFGHMSLVSPLANFFAVPVVGMLLTPMIFIASLVSMLSVPAAALVLIPVDWLMSVLSFGLAVVAQWEYSLKYVGAAGATVLLWSAGLALVCLMPVQGRIRWLALVLLLPVFFTQVDAPPHGGVRVTFLDVGQGTAVVVQTKNHVLVYDTGARFSESFNAADAVILPFLRTHGIDHVSMLMISHADGDHSGGAPALLDGISVEQTLVSASIDNIDAHPCRDGRHWQWDGVGFEVLHPQDNSIGSKNDRSCVLLITTENHRRVLLTGDIEARGEWTVLDRGVPEVDVLLAPHHGSATSSSRAFIAAVSPRFVVHTTGYRNRYGLPNMQVTHAYKNSGAQQFNTAFSGAVTFELASEPTADTDIRVDEFRRQSRALWHQHFAIEQLR